MTLHDLDPTLISLGPECHKNPQIVDIDSAPFYVRINIYATDKQTETHPNTQIHQHTEVIHMCLFCRQYQKTKNKQTNKQTNKPQLNRYSESFGSITVDVTIRYTLQKKSQAC